MIATGTAALEKLLGAKSLEAAIQIQSDYAKQSYEGFVAQSSKVSDLFAKFASEAMKPTPQTLLCRQPTTNSHMHAKHAHASLCTLEIYSRQAGVTIRSC